ncbi:hypothetical protein [Flavobacterium sp. JP2137]|uniref:hypothetical protein n=1 Tax=Flavobacterium sp. JP2137 TaxID=3414510 RepID=UPI003D2FF2F3
MKKLIYLSTLALAALTINSCSSDDDSTKNPLVGTWEATTLSYTYVEGMTNTHPFSQITAGCAVDVIELTEQHVGTVKAEEKVEQNCQATTAVATWSDSSIQVVGEATERAILAVDDKQMTLKYLMTYPKFGTIDVIVVYTRK